MTKTVHLVACASKKLPKPACAHDLYISPLFVKTRAVVEQTGDAWFILSALHGLVDPSKVLDPYDAKLSGLTREGRERWGNLAARDLARLVGKDVRLVFWAGRAYRDAMHWGVRQHLGWDVEREIPLEGLSIGQQLKRLDEMAKEAAS